VGNHRVANYNLGLPERPAEHLAELAREIGYAATAFATGLATNPFTRIEQGQLRLCRPDALPVSPEVRSCVGSSRAGCPGFGSRISCQRSTDFAASLRLPPACWL
jgi:hypothetical protein